MPKLPGLWSLVAGSPIALALWIIHRAAAWAGTILLWYASRGAPLSHRIRSVMLGGFVINVIAGIVLFGIGWLIIRLTQ